METILPLCHYYLGEWELTVRYTSDWERVWRSGPLNGRCQGHERSTLGWVLIREWCIAICQVNRHSEAEELPGKDKQAPEWGCYESTSRSTLQANRKLLGTRRTSRHLGNCNLRSWRSGVSIERGCVLLESISVDPVVEPWVGLSDWTEGACCDGSSIVAGSGSYDV